MRAPTRTLPAPPDRLEPLPLKRLEQAVNLLLCPTDRERDAWRRSVLGAVREYMDADRAAMMLLEPGAAPALYNEELPPGMIEEYLSDFAPLDHGMARRDELGLALWSRRLLWDEDELMRSAYFHDFALRHDLLDTVGVSLDIDGTPVHVRMVLLYGSAPLPTDRAEMLLRRLGLLLPVLHTGFGMHLRYERWLGTLPSVLDRIGERLVLYDIAGRELHRNVTMRRALAEDPERDRVLEAAQGVARAVGDLARAKGREASSLLASSDETRQEIRTAVARYRLRGCLMGPEVLGAEFAVLVSVDRRAPEPPTPETLRDRYGLTMREVQVACLLAQRLTNEEIAITLGISTHTARHHTESVLLKMGVSSRRALRAALSNP